MRSSGQITSGADTEFADDAFGIVWTLLQHLEEKHSLLGRVAFDVFLLVDGKPDWSQLAPDRMSVSRRGRMIYLKAGIGRQEWLPLDHVGRLNLFCNRIEEMLSAGCARAKQKLDVDAKRLDAFLSEFMSELRRRSRDIPEC